MGALSLLYRGGHELHGIKFRIPSDRIVAGTYLFSVIGTGGNIFLEDAPTAQMRSMLHVAEEIGAQIHVTSEGIHVIADEHRRAVPYLKTEIYPGFPTDMQSPLMAVLTTAQGVSVIEEAIFEDRFHIIEQLKKMGACIEQQGKRRAAVVGVDSLLGCEVTARELRGGAGLVIAGCMALGETIVRNRHFIERGYEDICRDYRNLGADIRTG